jgi:Zn-dependent protease with chaperone function
MAVGSTTLLVLGGIVPVIRGWLQNDVDRWSDVTQVLGGVCVSTETHDPDADIGPVMTRIDAPRLFTMVEAVARRLGVKPPGQIRLSYLPCCGVVAWNRDRSRALIIGLPLLRVLTQSELRAVVAHELAHLARGDATRAARSARFIEGLELALDRQSEKARGPLGGWAAFCHRLGSRLIEPVARGQESRADRLAATIAGGSATCSALVKVAMVQPLFKEVLERYDPTAPEVPNLYAFFRTFWYRLPAEVHSAMRLRILTERRQNDDPAHPPLPDRLASLQTYPDHPSVNGDAQPGTSFLGDLEVIEQMLHNRLFGLPPVEPSVFHRNGT